MSSENDFQELQFPGYSFNFVDFQDFCFLSVFVFFFVVLFFCELSYHICFLSPSFSEKHFIVLGQLCVFLILIFFLIDETYY